MAAIGLSTDDSTAPLIVSTSDGWLLLLDLAADAASDDYPAPEISIGAEPSAGIVGESIAVDVVITDDLGVAAFEVQVFDAGGGVEYGASGLLNTTEYRHAFLFEGQTEGDHTIRVTAVDFGGETAGAERVVSILSPGLDHGLDLPGDDVSAEKDVGHDVVRPSDDLTPDASAGPGTAFQEEWVLRGCCAQTRTQSGEPPLEGPIGLVLAFGYWVWRRR